MLAEFDAADDRWAWLHDMLIDCGYSTAEVLRLLGVSRPVEEMLGNIARWALHHSRNPALRNTACGLLSRLFLFNCEVETGELALLPPPLSSLLRGLGLLEYAQGDSTVVHGTASIVEYQNRYLISDALFSNRFDEITVHDDSRRCMPLHASSLELLRTLDRPPSARSFLDVGCGTGCQSILFAADYEHVTGIDSEPRAAMFAQVNAVLNGFAGEYRTDRWELLPDDRPYDHVAFNAPDSETAFAFIAQRASDLISRYGAAQVWTRCEVTAEDRDLTGLIERLCPSKTLEVRALPNRSSPFSLSKTFIQEKTLPRDTLLVRTAKERQTYLSGLAERGVTEIVSVTLTVRHR